MFYCFHWDLSTFFICLWTQLLYFNGSVFTVDTFSQWLVWACSLINQIGMAWCEAAARPGRWKLGHKAEHVRKGHSSWSLCRGVRDTVSVKDHYECKRATLQVDINCCTSAKVVAWTICHFLLPQIASIGVLFIRWRSTDDGSSGVNPNHSDFIAVLSCFHEKKNPSKMFVYPSSRNRRRVRNGRT